MRMIKRILRKLVLLPVLAITGAAGEITSLVDMDELTRIVDERTARAENSVLRDYFSQLGLSEEQSKEANAAYRSHRRSMTPSNEQLAEAKQRAAAAELSAKKTRAEAEARVQMALLGVREECFSDVLTLAADGLSRAAEGDTADSSAVKAAIEGVLDRVPSFTDGGQRSTTGSAGRFPRGNSVAESYQQRLNRARELHDNAAAASIIGQAAARGISLR